MLKKGCGPLLDGGARSSTRGSLHQSLHDWRRNEQELRLGFLDLLENGELLRLPFPGRGRATRQKIQRTQPSRAKRR